MSQIERSLHLPYTQEQLYALVSDIRQYPEFLPYCLDAKILREQGPRVEGTVRVGYKGLGYNFTTHNTLHPTHRISMQLLSGPFQRLQGEWKFEPEPQGCRVTLHLIIVFKHALLGMMFKHKIDELTDLMVQAFVKRAQDLYG